MTLNKCCVTLFLSEVRLGFSQPQNSCCKCDILFTPSQKIKKSALGGSFHLPVRPFLLVTGAGESWAWGGGGGVLQSSPLIIGSCPWSRWRVIVGRLRTETRLSVPSSLPPVIKPDYCRIPYFLVLLLGAPPRSNFCGRKLLWRIGTINVVAISVGGDLCGLRTPSGMCWRGIIARRRLTDFPRHFLYCFSVELCVE